MNEFGVIEKYFAPLATDFVGADNLKDDVAVLDVPDGHELVVTSDTLNAGVHFLENTSPDLIARKALRVNLSDLVAKGARPYAYQLNLALPKETDENWIASFTKGLQEDQNEFGVSLCGGDTTSTNGSLSISITAFGLVETGKIVRRSGAKPGDHVYVTGTIGDAYLGLKMLQGEFQTENVACIAKHQCPIPRVDHIKTIQKYANASMDISDGLVADLGHLCRTSNVGTLCQFSDIPFSQIGKAYQNPEELLTGGDDYELLFTSSKDIQDENISKIGIITAEKDVNILDEKGKPLVFDLKGWQHF